MSVLVVGTLPAGITSIYSTSQVCVWAWSDQQYFDSPIDGMQVSCRGINNIKCTDTQSYTWVEKDIARVKCLTQEHNTIASTIPGLEPKPLDSKFSVLTTGLHLPDRYLNYW